MLLTTASSSMSQHIAIIFLALYSLDMKLIEAYDRSMQSSANQSRTSTAVIPHDLRPNIASDSLRFCKKVLDNFAFDNAQHCREKEQQQTTATSSLLEATSINVLKCPEGSNRCDFTTECYPLRPYRKCSLQFLQTHFANVRFSMLCPVVKKYRDITGDLPYNIGWCLTKEAYEALLKERKIRATTYVEVTLASGEGCLGKRLPSIAGSSKSGSRS